MLREMSVDWRARKMREDKTAQSQRSDPVGARTGESFQKPPDKIAYRGRIAFALIQIGHARDEIAVAFGGAVKRQQQIESRFGIRGPVRPQSRVHFFAQERPLARKAPHGPSPIICAVIMRA